jgi:hypothetical protein
VRNIVDTVARVVDDGEEGRCGMAGMVMHMHASPPLLGLLWGIE